jgi:ADP-ribose pyrophosphatase YjhB (NUDIX family)
MARTECTTHSLIVDVTVLTDTQVLLVRYQDTNRYDHQGGWFLPDDALRHHEHPDQGARRVAREQLGYALGKPRLHHVESFTGNDGTWHIPFHYVARLRSIPRLQPSKDIAAAQWFDLDALPPSKEVAHRGWALATIRVILKDR